MVKVQQSRLADARAAVVQFRLDAMKTMVQEVVSTITGLTLCTMEVALRIPEVVKILDPHVPTFDEDALRQNLKIWIHKYVENRDEYARRSLVALVREKCSLDPHCDPFSLAVGTIFICTNCATGRPLLHATRHHCPGASHHDTIHEEDEGEYANAVWAAASQWYDAKGIWSARTYEHGLTKLMKAIKCCGLDVKTATIEDLDQADVLFQELPHGNAFPHRFIPIMGWRAAVSLVVGHYPRFHNDGRESHRSLEPSGVTTVLISRKLQRTRSLLQRLCYLLLSSSSAAHGMRTKCTVVHSVLARHGQAWDKLHYISGTRELRHLAPGNSGTNGTVGTGFLNLPNTNTLTNILLSLSWAPCTSSQKAAGRTHMMSLHFTLGCLGRG